MMMSEFVARLRHRWWVVVTVAALGGLGAWAVLAARVTMHESTVQLVVHPSGSLLRADVPNALDVLGQDGVLMQTLAGVLGGREMLERAAAEGEVGPVAAGYSLESTIPPGSSLIDVTVSGPDEDVVAALAGGLVSAGEDYVARNYTAYELDSLGIEAAGPTGPRAVEVVVLAVFLGAALGVGIAFAGTYLDARLRASLLKIGGTAPSARCRAMTSTGERCRNRPADERGYCDAHLGRIAEKAAAPPEGIEGSGTAVIREFTQRPPDDAGVARDESAEPGRAAGRRQGDPES